MDDMFESIFDDFASNLFFQPPNGAAHIHLEIQKIKPSHDHDAKKEKEDMKINDDELIVKDDEEDHSGHFVVEGIKDITKDDKISDHEPSSPSAAVETKATKAEIKNNDSTEIKNNDSAEIKSSTKTNKQR